jgi:zinc transport system substrate-binding protein
MKLLINPVLVILGLCLMTLVHAEQKLVVYTVNYPLQYFAQQIGGDAVEVHFPAPGDVDPASWTPDSAALSGYQTADVILLNGAGYAQWINKVSLPRLNMVNTSEGFMVQYITTDLNTAHSDEWDGGLSHASLAFTTWLDFRQALQQARAILKVLKQKRPELSAQFDHNYSQLELQLMNLDRRMQVLLLKHPDVLIWTSRPVYEYMARRYGMNIQSVLWKPGVPLNNKDIDELKKGLRKYPSHLMIWEAEPLAASIQTLKKMGLQSLVFNPVANVPEQGDFMTVMNSNIDKLASALQ